MSQESNSTRQQIHTLVNSDLTNTELQSLGIDSCAPTQKKREIHISYQIVCFCNGKGCTICNGTGYMTMPHITYIANDTNKQVGT